jgi:hypothetical protein
MSYAVIHVITCFGSSLSSSGSFCICLSYVKNTNRYGGLSHNVVKWPVCVGVSMFSVLCFTAGKVQCVVLHSWERSVCCASQLGRFSILCFTAECTQTT